MFHFIHASDFHLDSSFRALSPRQAVQRRQESREVVARLANCARQRDAGLVLLSGDLFDGAEVYRETIEALARVLGELHVPVFIAPGNHDWYGTGSPYATENWPDNVHIFRSGEMGCAEVPELNCVVHGAAFTAPEQTESLLAGFAAPTDGKIHLMVLHADVEGAAGRYNSITREEIAASGLTYLALGHVHAASGPQTAGGTVWAYPGCPEGRGFDELGDKGCYLGTVDDSGAVGLEFLSLARRRYEIVETDVTGKKPRQAVESALPENTVNDLYRILLTGETDERSIDLPALQEALSNRFYVLELRDLTRIREDVWARAGEDSLRGLFLRRLRARFDKAATEEERETVTQAVRFGLAALDHRDLL